MMRWAIVFAAAVAAGPVLGRAGVLGERDALTAAAAVCVAAMALSLNLIMGYAKRLSLGHAALAGLGAFVSGLSTARGWQVPFVVGLIAAVLAGGLAGFVLGLLTSRLRGIWFAFATLAFALALDGSVFAWSAGTEVPRPKIGSFVLSSTADYLAVAVAVFALLWLVDRNLMSSRFGRSIRATAGEAQVAISRGVGAARALAVAFVVSGAMAGAAGALYTHFLEFIDAQTFAYERLALPIVALVAIGGAGSRVAVSLAGVGYVLAPRFVAPLRGWETIVSALGLIYAVAVHPDGMAGFVRSMRARRRREFFASTVPRFTELGRPLPTTEPPVLQVRELSVARDGEPVLTEVSIEIAPGSMVGIIGPNGAGKTTLLDAISGLVPVDGGEIVLGARDITRTAPEQRIDLGLGRTFEKTGLIDELSLMDNLLLSQQHSFRYGAVAALGTLPSQRREEAAARRTAIELASACGLAPRLHTRADELSYGQRRLAELACVIASGTPVLLLDEPSAGLSAEARAELAAFLSGLRGRYSILLVEHDVALATSVCDHLYTLEAGQLVADGPDIPIAGAEPLEDALP